MSRWSKSPLFFGPSIDPSRQVNRSSSRGFTALHAAAENGQVPVMPLSGKVNPWKMLRLCGVSVHYSSAPVACGIGESRIITSGGSCPG